MKEGALCYLIADKADEWIYIELGDVRGFVDSEYLDYGEEVVKDIEDRQARKESDPSKRKITDIALLKTIAKILQNVLTLSGNSF